MLIRVNRNCPWNRCTFCPVYKGKRFSRRPAEDIQRDIDAIAGYVDLIYATTDGTRRPAKADIDALAARVPSEDAEAFAMAARWTRSGRRRSVFLQDADALATNPADLEVVLRHLHTRFPSIKRVTAYTRSTTVVSRGVDTLTALRQAGLSRLHLGLESGCDDVLAMVTKGATRAKHVAAGLAVKAAGIELSEYYMPGLGGQAYSRPHALESADAINQINPDFLRLRTLALMASMPLFDDWQQGRFQRCTETEVAHELVLFLNALAGISTTVKSDHFVNLLADVEGTLPQDKDLMMAAVQSFLDLPPHQRMLYQLGRRLGWVNRVTDLAHEATRHRLQTVARKLNATPGNVDDITNRLTGQTL